MKNKPRLWPSCLGPDVLLQKPGRTWGAGCCLGEPMSPRSWAQLGYSASLKGSEKPRWARKGFRSKRLINGPTGFHSRSCLSSWLLPTETNPIHGRLQISLLMASSLRSKAAFVLFSLIFPLSLLFSFSLLLCSLKTQNSRYKLGQENLVDMMVDSGFTVYVNSRNMLYFSEPSFSLLHKGDIRNPATQGLEED